MKKLAEVYVRAVGAYVPPRRVTNDELAQTVDTSDDWIRSHTGIGARHLADESVTTSDLAVGATKDMLKRHGIQLPEIGAIVVATSTQDYLGFPATACVVQEKLGLQVIPAFDISAGCTGFIYALEVARGLVATGTVPSVLVIGAEKLSAITDWSDRNTCVLFGDGAGCVLVQGGQGGEGEIVDSVLHAEGSGGSYLCIPQGGTSAPFDTAVPLQGHKLHMDGRAVYNFAVRVLKEVVDELLSRNHLVIEDIDWIVPHQANSRIISAAAKRLKIDQAKFFMNIEDYANTSAASIPIALREMEEQGLLKRGQRIMTIGFGAGLTYGGNLIIW
ncbi:MAG: beta-ketoacyl-ACP synthase III [Sphaerochaetaceae bacterium]|jgi:3-oxoacyl-[acyl-carrier-protein] synthase-3|nr:ketoacyl-ACP synthase III [Sphaerochaetaceae bacterium]MDD3366690.1 ketoacyl-ACP synthase III [Sphaerochaetaceae bacterium]MDD4218894.1 ketoacyl-ACP synthase III [Sphaerochaetaceae bacterium]MDY0371442.1 beta-ketoacyl-ACP synthase III [Sphaerochaetaceae bacterium]